MLDYKFFIQLSPTLTKLCHIKRDYLVHIMCAKYSPSAKTRAFRRLHKSLIALLIIVCGNHYKINTFIMSTHMSDRHDVNSDVICSVSKLRS